VHRCNEVIALGGDNFLEKTMLEKIYSISLETMVHIIERSQLGAWKRSTKKKLVRFYPPFYHSYQPIFLITNFFTR
jgi:hypothetical protein